VIAVVDTGVDLGHPDLAGKFVAGINLVNPGQSPQDDNGHGTHVAGIAAASTDNAIGVAGVAPDALIMPVKALDSTGSGSAQAVANGITYAADHGAQVINLSLGGGFGQSVFGPSFGAAIEYAWSRNAICVVAAGNTNLLGSGFSNQHAVVVSAVGPNDSMPMYSDAVGGAMWGMAAPGGAADGKLVGKDPVDDIVSTFWDPDPKISGAPHVYAYLAGTSMAAPHVSGAAAILRGLGLSPQQTVDRLLSTAANLGNPGTFGHGRLDVAAAVAGLPPDRGGAPTTTTTAPPPPTTVATTVAPRPKPTAAPAPVTAAPSTTASTSTTVAPGPAVALSPPAQVARLPIVPRPASSDHLPAITVGVAIVALAGVALGAWIVPRRVGAAGP
jgi:subtilisin family serine protease